MTISGKSLLKVFKILFASWYAPYFYAIINGVIAGVEHSQVLCRLKYRTVVDIGANCGQFALVSRKCLPKAKIISFEPLAEPAERFYYVFRNDHNIRLHQAAIGPWAGETTIHVAASDDSSSLLPITPFQEQLFPGTGEIRTERVKIGRLSDYLLPEEIVGPAMLKVDVQGYELETLRGCEDLLTRFSSVYAECSFVELYAGQNLVDDIVSWLRQRGWTIRGIYNMTYACQGKSIQADFLFENSCASI